MYFFLGRLRRPNNITYYSISIKFFKIFYGMVIYRDFKIFKNVASGMVIYISIYDHSPLYTVLQTRLNLYISGNIWEKLERNMEKLENLEASGKPS